MSCWYVVIEGLIEVISCVACLVCSFEPPEGICELDGETLIAINSPFR